MRKTFTAIIEYDPKAWQYIGIVPNVPGVHTVEDSIEEMRRNLKEVLELVVLKEAKEKVENLEFCGP